MVRTANTNGADAKHQWCERQTPMVWMLSTNSAENKTPYYLLLG
nr:hypothetical protein [uncultured Prevotella sp.]